MTISEVKKRLQNAGTRPHRSSGQHFLLDETIVEQMADIAKVQAGDTVLEIGPGLGVLTDVLLARGAHVIAVELDPRLADYLRRTHKHVEHLQVIDGDIFRVRLDAVLGNTPFKLVSNLPYNITSMVLRFFLSGPLKPTDMTILIQREVAERAIAGPGKMSLLALSVQWFSKPRKMLDVEGHSFFPIPEVVSSVLHCADIASGYAPDMEKEVFRLAKMGFAGKRKQLRNSLGAGLHQKNSQVDELLLTSGIAPEARPQDLSIENWLTLTKTVSKKV